MTVNDDVLRLCAVGDVTAFHKEPETGYEFVGPVLGEMDMSSRRTNGTTAGGPTSSRAAASPNSRSGQRQGAQTRQLRRDEFREQPRDGPGPDVMLETIERAA